MLSWLILTVSAILALNSLGLSRHNRLVVPHWVVFSLMLGTYSYGLTISPSQVVFWSYPIPLYFLFCANEKTSQFTTVVWFFTCTVLGYFHLPHDIAFRSSVTLGLVCSQGLLFNHMIRTLESSLQRLAIRDTLTGLLNRKTMDKSLRLAIERAKRGQETCSLAILDIDHFKAINDNHGHQVGDRVLTGVAKILKHRLRQLDLIFRYGGEEFLVLLSGADIEGGLTAAEALRSIIESSDLLPNEKVTASFGVAQVAPTEEPADWLRRADEALYVSKSRGRNCVSQAQCGFWIAENLHIV